MKYTSLKSLVVGSSLLAFSCSRPEVSETKEAIDANSALEQLGDIGSPTYSDIAQTKSVATATTPWTDTYWPLTEKGLSRRWEKSEKVVGLAEFFSVQTAQSKESKIDPLLSPADKYDILYRWRHNKAIDEKTVEDLVKSWDGMETGLNLEAEVSETRGEIRKVMKDFNSFKLANFRSQFPMSTDGWKNWLYYTSADQYKFLDKEESGEDWSWMGSCHGWAPAALMAETPKNAVLAKFDDKEVLVTEGDIRGLLTKSWADHSPDDSQFFLGRRCEKNLKDPEGEIPHDGNGRGYYGEITRGESKTSFFVKSEMYAAFTRSADRIYPLSYEQNGMVEGFLLETYQGSRRYSYVLSKSLAELQAYVVRGEMAGVEQLDEVEMFGCWDVNPATFHMALLQKIGKESVGLVMDRTRTGQVWNQPVYAADFKMSELLKLSSAPFSKTRAPGTRYLANVTTTVKWISEPALPRFVYTKEFNDRHIQETTYTYVLEFDANKRLIGGEWGELNSIDPKQITPDFIYGFGKGSKPTDDLKNGFDFSGIIEKIHACSLSGKIDGTAKINNQKIPYSECVLTKAQ